MSRKNTRFFVRFWSPFLSFSFFFAFLFDARLLLLLLLLLCGETWLLVVDVNTHRVSKTTHGCTSYVYTNYY